MNPVVVMPDTSELLRTLSESEDAYYAYGWSDEFQQDLANYCNILTFQLPAIDKSFPRSGYILRRGLPKNVYERLDLGLMALGNMAENVCSTYVYFPIPKRTYGMNKRCSFNRRA